MSTLGAKLHLHLTFMAASAFRTTPTLTPILCWPSAKWPDLQHPSYLLSRTPEKPELKYPAEAKRYERRGIRQADIQTNSRNIGTVSEAEREKTKLVQRGAEKGPEKGAHRTPKAHLSE